MNINLCSGQHPFPKPWVNVDIQPRWNPDVVADGASMPMFTDNSADMIVIEHGLEHFGCGEADAMLGECWRIIKPGGSLIVTAPDLKALAKRWLLGQIDDYTYAVNVYGAYMGDPADRHKWMVSDDQLRKSIGARWSAMKPFDFRALNGVRVAQDWWIAGYEAVK